MDFNYYQSFWNDKAATVQGAMIADDGRAAEQTLAATGRYSARQVATALEMGWDEMVAVALDGVDATWLDEGEKRALRADFEREIAAIPPPA